MLAAGPTLPGSEPKNPCGRRAGYGHGGGGGTEDKQRATLCSTCIAVPSLFALHLDSSVPCRSVEPFTPFLSRPFDVTATACVPGTCTSALPLPHIHPLLPASTFLSAPTTVIRHPKTADNDVLSLSYTRRIQYPLLSAFSRTISLRSFRWPALACSNIFLYRFLETSPIHTSTWSRI